MRYLILLASLVLSIFPSLAFADPLYVGQWPSDVPRPQPAEGGRHLEVAGGYPSDDRRIVAITFSNASGKPMLCSGLWISRAFVLTAAHCTCEGQDYLISNEKRAISDDRRPVGHWIRASLASRLGNEACKGRSPLGSDLALLKLSSDLEIAPGQPAVGEYSLLGNIITLAHLSDPWEPITLSGYGYDGNIAASSGLRREAVAKLNTPFCTEKLAIWLGCAPLREFMAGGGSAKIDTCASDSGAPAFRRVGVRFLPIGIVSRGLPVNQPYGAPGYCGAGGIYTTLGRISVISWLEKGGVPSGREAEQ